MNKKLIAAIAIALCSTGALAEWKAWGESAPGVTRYFDTSTFRTNVSNVPEWRTIWVLDETGANPTRRASSFATLLSFDCKDDTSKPVAATTWSGPMGTGDSTPFPIKHPTEHLSPGTKLAAFGQFICTKEAS